MVFIRHHFLEIHVEILKNFNLKHFNTFGICAQTDYFASVHSADELIEILANSIEPKLILGGGSNILFTENFHGLVIHIELKGIEIVEENENSVKIRVEAGENWHEFVKFCVERNFGGIENLSLIPGTVGAAPVQNIGAYGVELRDILVELTALIRNSGEFRTFSNEECGFGYRDSIFKRELKNSVVITSVTIELSKNLSLKTDYGAIRDELSGIVNPTIQDVSEAVCRIRMSKLPNPAELGNSGSFFKNPEISSEKFDLVLNLFPKIPHFTAPLGKIKIPAGWLIEQSGWKGFRDGDAGVHKQQALVLVNYGNANGKEILDLAQKIQASVREKFDIHLETEVNII